MAVLQSGDQVKERPTSQDASEGEDA
ncbi:uncharacterized protein G2W53_021790 [Senna tora]|uniref:Uncharacterized protein n=1 Tax=Senna tora TaxID=362788 RepID=A0A834TMK1_9FABA|nr:uncharacterized protein G2W53_021790 [Senna tora]